MKLHLCKASQLIVPKPRIKMKIWVVFTLIYSLGVFSFFFFSYLHKLTTSKAIYIYTNIWVFLHLYCFSRFDDQSRNCFLKLFLVQYILFFHTYSNIVDYFNEFFFFCIHKPTRPSMS